MSDQPLIIILQHIDYAIFAPKARFNSALYVIFPSVRENLTRRASIRAVSQAAGPSWQTAARGWPGIQRAGDQRVNCFRGDAKLLGGFDLLGRQGYGQRIPALQGDAANTVKQIQPTRGDDRPGQDGKGGLGLLQITLQSLGVVVIGFEQIAPRAFETSLDAAANLPPDAGNVLGRRNALLLHGSQNLLRGFISRLRGVEQPMVVQGCQRGPAIRVEVPGVRHGAEGQNVQPLFESRHTFHGFGGVMLPAQPKRMAAESLNEG